VHVVAPERGWYTHPSHHALEDLLKKLQKEHAIAGGKFHVFGFAGGAGPATTYSRMSAKYFASLSIASGTAWTSYDDGDYRDWKRHAARRFEAEGVPNTLTVLPEAGRLLGGLHGPELLQAVVGRIAPGSGD